MRQSSRPPGYMPKASRAGSSSTTMRTCLRLAHRGL
ncbi:DUF3704 domain-containing protein [Luteibacter jiangsuensis]|uniref:DUF3704 domain-containing protein n=1 Tax=Luteibacter jiangsuensis TaxID=637577 RepID=A0ABX0Q5G9_9GAMM|nr:DUF3704 domain-containing protein [Luteibacter jiangsuensis]